MPNGNLRVCKKTATGKRPKANSRAIWASATRPIWRCWCSRETVKAATNRRTGPQVSHQTSWIGPNPASALAAPASVWTSFPRRRPPTCPGVRRCNWRRAVVEAVEVVAAVAVEEEALQEVDQAVAVHLGDCPGACLSARSTADRPWIPLCGSPSRPCHVPPACRTPSTHRSSHRHKRSQALCHTPPSRQAPCCRQRLRLPCLPLLPLPPRPAPPAPLQSMCHRPCPTYHPRHCPALYRYPHAPARRPHRPQPRCLRTAKNGASAWLPWSEGGWPSP